MPTTCTVIGYYNQQHTKEFTKFVVKFLKGQTSGAVVGWLLSTGEARMESR